MKTFDILLERDGAVRWSRYIALCEQCRATQQSLLEELVRKNATCEFGRTHRFERLSSISEFRRVVPISTWSRFAAYIENLVRSGGNVLTSDDPVVRFNLTSGTSASPKLVPLTRRGQRASAITLELRLWLALRDHPAALRARFLPYVHESAHRRTALGILYGSPASASLTSAPAEIARSFAYPPAALELHDGLARRYAMLRFALGHAVSAAAGNNPLSFVRLFELASEHRTQLIDDIRRGTLTPPVESLEPTPPELVPHLRPDPERAAALAAIEGAGFVPRSLWPELRLFLCWKTGVMSRSIPELLERCADGTVVREFGYGASEGLFTIPLGDQGSEGVLAVHGIFYEFLPEDAALTPHAHTLLAHELVPGCRYQLVLTNCSGLYRYAIEDIVEVTGFVGEAPTLVFIRRTGDIVNMVGEKIESSRVVAALQHAQVATGVGIRHFQLIADATALRYELCVEPLHELDDARSYELLQRFEAALAGSTDSYAVLREGGLIAAPRIRVMKRGWLDALLESDGRDGSTEVKPRVVGERLACAQFSDRVLTVEIEAPA